MKRDNSAHREENTDRGWRGVWELLVCNQSFWIFPLTQKTEIIQYAPTGSHKDKNLLYKIRGFSNCAPLNKTKKKPYKIHLLEKQVTSHMQKQRSCYKAWAAAFLLCWPSTTHTLWTTDILNDWKRHSEQIHHHKTSWVLAGVYSQIQLPLRIPIHLNEDNVILFIPSWNLIWILFFLVVFCFVLEGVFLLLFFGLVLFCFSLHSKME